LPFTAAPSPVLSTGRGAQTDGPPRLRPARCDGPTGAGDRHPAFAASGTHENGLLGRGPPEGSGRPKRPWVRSGAGGPGPCVSVLDRRRLEGRLALLDVDLEAHGPAGVLLHRLVPVLAQLGDELVVGHALRRLTAAGARGNELLEHVVEVLLLGVH